MSKDSRAAAESAAGTPLRMARCELAGSGRECLRHKKYMGSYVAEDSS